MPATAHCPICLNDFAIDADKPEFVIFPCGHGFCEGCTSQLFPLASEKRASCPNCRKVIHRRDGHPVYLQLVDSKSAFANKVIEGFGNMSASTPLLSLKKASVKLGQVAKGNPDGNTMLPLLKAIEDFNERIIPHFTTVENQKQEIEALRKELHRSQRERDSTQNKLRKAESLQTEVVHLRNALSESEANTQEAIRLAEVAKDDLGKVHAASGQWQRRAAELDQENKRFKDMLERHASVGRLQREKNRKLHKQLAAMKEEKAEAEKATMSDALTHEYDGDFSGHERSRPQSSFHTITPSPSRATRRSIQDENDNSLDFVGMPPPSFPSDWHLEPGVLKRRTMNGAMVGSQRRAGGTFPISLDRKGCPTKAVQLGPRSIIHVGR